MVFFFTRCLNISPEKKWYFSVILLSNVNLDHVRLYVCCVFQLIEAVIHHLQSFWQLWDPKSSVRPFSKRSRRQSLHSNFQQQLWVNFGLDWERLSRMIFFLHTFPGLLTEPIHQHVFFFFKSRKSLTSKKGFQNHHRKPKLTPNGSASSAVGCFISFTYSKHVARSAASALSLIYYYWLQGCSNRVMEILDWLPEPRKDPFRLPGSNGSSWMTGGRRRVQQQEHTRTPNMLRQHGTTLTRIPNNSLRLLFPFFFFLLYTFHL